MPERGILIVGGGESAANAARSLRENGWRGPVTMISEEPLPPYERPPLSKTALTSSGAPEPISILGAAQFDEWRIDTVLGAQVVAIDPVRHAAVTRAHGEFAYERLLLATGADARRLSVQGGE